MSMNVLSRASGRPARLGAIAALLAVSLLAPAGAAQEAATTQPAHIHSGTCQTLGDVAAPLSDVAAPKAATTPIGAASARPVETSTTRVDMPLQAIIDGGHAINVHKSADEIGVYIACGDIGGMIDDEELVIGLGEVNHSGYSGVAVLDGDDEATEVTVYLLPPAVASASATPAVQAPSATTQTVSVAIKDFKFAPATIEVPAGGSITWTNEDHPPHTVTAVDHSVANSGTLAFGQSFTREFDTPGSYEYFCLFHPGMKGTIVVK
jgi:plastocyanin